MRVSGAVLASINEVVCDISVVLGATTMPIHQMLRMSRGAIIELEATEDDEVTILANNLPVAKGTVSVNGNRIGVAITRLLSRPEAESRR
jgi:flagellar motor switch protein FliN